MNKVLLYTGIVLLILSLFFGNLFYGAVRIPAGDIVDILLGKEVERMAWTNIILQSRLPQALTALLTGCALAVCGLVLQTLFQNPLAGPSILGISDGANLGVAIVMLYFGGSIGSPTMFSIGYSLSAMAGALIGALSVLALMVYLSARIKSNIMILIIGIMIGYLASSGIAVLNFLSHADGIRSYVIWGMGSFSTVSMLQMPFYAMVICCGLGCSILLIKPLNTLLLGEQYAANLGVNITQTRMAILFIAGLLIAATTAFCGPISFIGLAVPHIAKLSFNTANHKTLLPATLLLGGSVALLCNMLTILPVGKTILPINAVTPLLGAPVILYVILKKKG